LLAAYLVTARFALACALMTILIAAAPSCWAQNPLRRPPQEKPQTDAPYADSPLSHELMPCVASEPIDTEPDDAAPVAGSTSPPLADPMSPAPDDGNVAVPYQQPDFGNGPGPPTGMPMSPNCPPPRCLPLLEFFGLRHSYTDGRSIGYGWPLVGTSWLNRPYYVGSSLGVLGMANRIETDVRPDVDTFGGLFVGWDWDYYWGSEIQFERATPELTNKRFPDVRSGNVMNLWSYDWMYYPWGDSTIRPFWRLGIGSTYVDYVGDDGHRRDEELWTLPIGVGVKYPIYHWLAGRLEFTDHLALGNRGVSTLNNLTLTFALEWHFGAHPPSYWPWNPSRHLW
jgi:hypothetical protein